jgi:hypothetical protein
MLRLKLVSIGWRRIELPRLSRQLRASVHSDGAFAAWLTAFTFERG